VELSYGLLVHNVGQLDPLPPLLTGPNVGIFISWPEVVMSSKSPGSRQLLHCLLSQPQAAVVYLRTKSGYLSSNDHHLFQINNVVLRL
jgi:hypothetical protein